MAWGAKSIIEVVEKRTNGVETIVEEEVNSIFFSFCFSDFLKSD
jgi:hypothetical protein